MNLTGTDIANLIKFSKKDLLSYAQLIDKNYEWTWFHQVIAYSMERVIKNIQQKKKSRIILALPPRCGKSYLASILFPSWALGCNPSLRFILSTYGAELSEKMGSKTRDVMTSEKYKQIFPKTRLRKDTKSKSHFMTTEGGSYTSTGIGGAITGIGADCLTPDTIILTEKGELTIEHLYHLQDRPKVLSYNHETNKTEWKRIEATREILHTTKRLYQIQTKNGRRITCTADHRIFTNRGYIEAKDLTIGDTILIQRSESYDGSSCVEGDTISVVQELHNTSSVYDIQVEGNHNFFANNILVHNCIIIDDPFKSREEAESKTYQDLVWEYYRSTLYSRLEGYGAIIVIMQRWNNNDLIARLLDEQKTNGGDEWEIINFPAIAICDEEYREEGQPLWESKFPLPVLENIRQNVGTLAWNCTPKETPILMSDWSYKKISEINVGDEVIGFTREIGQGTSGKLINVKVQNVFSKKSKVCDLKMKSGRTVRCTTDHRWYTGRGPTEKEPHRKMYESAKIGKKLMFITDPNFECSEQDKKNWAYLAGIVDGEGSVKRGVVDISQSLTVNSLICEKIERTVKELNLTYSRQIIEREKYTPQLRIVISKAKEVYPKLMNIGDSAKRNQMIEMIMNHSSKYIRERDEILDIKESENEEDVYAIETESGNYVAWGYASSNSQYQQDPIWAEDQEFKEDMFKYFEEEELKGRNLRYYTICDPAISQKREADNTVVLTIAKDLNGPNIYRIREDAGHFTPSQTVDLIFKHTTDYRSDAYIEVVGYQQALKFSIEEEQRKKQKYFSVHEVRTRTNKEVRIRGLIPLYERGVIFHRHIDGKYEEELITFPRGRRDDRIDAMAIGLSVMDNTLRSVEERIFKPHWVGYGKKLKKL